MRLGASTRFFSQAQQRTRIHSPLVTIRQNAMLSLNFLMRMKKTFLLLTLLFGILSAWAHDAEVDGIFYNLNKADKTATVTFKGANFDPFKGDYAGDEVRQDVDFGVEVRDLHHRLVDILQRGAHWRSLDL